MDPAMSPLLTATLPGPDYETHTLGRSPERSRGPAIGMPHSPDVTVIRQENQMLKARTRQLQNELQAEQETVSSLRRKINAAERDRLDSVAKANDEAARLDSEVTRLRATVEKSEAVRQNLEFEFAKVRRELGQDKRSATDRENLLAELNESMKQKISDFSQQVEQLCQELETSKAKSQEEVARLCYTLDERDNHISQMRSEQDILEAEKDKVESALSQQEASIQELEIRIKELEDERRTMADGIRRQATEMDMMKERDQRSKRDMEAAVARIKALDEGIEAERAAHLESKFNSEIVQLRIRDLEGAFEVEKTAKTEAIAMSEKSNNQIKELQSINEEQRREAIQSREKLEKAEKEYALINQQLQGDLEKKNNIINKLSKQLELHQKNFDELKDELNKAKKRQIYLEETYGGSMRELELLLNSFNLDAEPKRVKASKTSKKRDVSKGIPPSVVLENLRHTLIEYKRRLDNTATELTKMKSQHDQLAKESSMYKDMIWAKDKALENTAHGLTRTSKDLQRSKTDVGDLERQLVVSRNDLEMLRQTLDREHSQHLEVKEQLIKLATKYKTDEQARTEFLHGIYHQLMMGRLSTGAEKVIHAKSSWSELTMMVQEQMANTIHFLNRAEEKVRHLENVAGSKDTAVSQMQRVHEEQLENLAGVAEDRGTFWQQQKAELEEHYGQLLGEIQARNKKTQSLADQAWEKVRVSETVQQSLKAEIKHLQQQVDQYGTENKVLLTTCTLICGTIYPLYARATALATQRNLLSEQLNKFDSFKQHIQKLVNALTTDQEGEMQANPQYTSSGSPRMSPLLRFRVAAIAVLATNRLVHMTKGNCRMFTACDALPGVHRLLVCTGGVLPKEKEFQGVATPCSLAKDMRCGQELAGEWLTSRDFMATLMASMTDLHTTLSKAQQHGSELDAEHLINVAKSSFSKLIVHLPSTFPTVSIDTEAGLREKVSLIRYLGHGLKRVVAHCDLQGQTSLCSSQKTLTSLRQQVLAFTRHLHAAEVERRDMRVELTTLRQERDTWQTSAANADHLAAQVNQFKQQLDTMVPLERFESVCHELDSALSRERQAQDMLTKQAHQLKTITQAMNRQAADGTEKEETLTELVQGLSDAKTEMRCQEQLVRQLNRQLSQLQSEKKILQTNVTDAENALRTVAKDKDVMTGYLKNVERAVEKTKVSSSVGPIDVTPVLSPDLLPREASRVSTEVAACQLVVTAFVDAQGVLNNRIRALQEEIASHKSHINTLKRELSAAFKREYDDELRFGDGVPEKDVAFAGRSLEKTPKVNTFTPLIEDKSTSFIVPPKASLGPGFRTEPTQDQPSKLTNPKAQSKAKSKLKAKDPCSCRSAGQYRIPRQAPRQGILQRSRTNSANLH